MGTRFPFGKLKMFWKLVELVVQNTVGILNVTVLYTLKCLILCYVNFTSRKILGCIMYLI